MVRRYEPMDGENVDYDDKSRYQQQRKKPRDGGGVGRYEVGRPSLQSLQATVKGKFLTIYTNGEKFKHDPPIKVMFSKKKFPKLPSLLDEIARAKERINKTAVVYLFKWPSGEKVEEVNEIEIDEDTNTYICSDVRSLFKRGRYGGVEFGGGAANSGFANSRNSYESRGTARSDKPSPTGAGPYGQINGASRGPVTINIISNTNRESRQSLFIDPRSNQPFEAILKNIEEMIEMEYPPCKALFSIKKPYKKVDSISSLNRIVPVYGDTFWACGQEGEPPEKSSGSRDVSPMRNGTNQKGKQNGYHDGKVRQSDGHMRRSEAYEDSRGREFQRHHDQYEEDEDPVEEDRDYDREPSPPRNRPQNLKDHSPRRDSKLATDRSNKGRYEDESHHEDEPPKKLQKPKQETKPAPKKNTKDNKIKSPRDEEDTDEGRYEDENQQDDEPPKKQQKPKQETKPAPKKNTKENKNKSPRDEDDTDEEKPAPKKTTKGNNRSRGDGDDSDDDSRGNSPTESEMQARIDAMDRAKSDLDKDIEF